MSDAVITQQGAHMTRMEYIAYHTIIFSQEKTSFMAGYNPSCILSTMLQHRQSIKQHLVNWRFTGYTNYSTHNNLADRLGLIKRIIC